jgi:hypothetical protein
MTLDFPNGTIRYGYDSWINELPRAVSGELGFGTWWRTDGAHWRLSWIEDTGELFAVELEARDRFVFLGKFAKKDINTLMRGWYGGDNLSLFIQKCIDRAASGQG